MENNLFLDFLTTVDQNNKNFVEKIHTYFLEHCCQCTIKTAKSGYTLSYLYQPTKKTIATFVCRKTGTKLRIFPQKLNEYEDFLDTLPTKMKKEIQKASVCKRLINPDDCNPKCPQGYEFTLDHIKYQKCRYNAFMLTLSPENNPYIKMFLEKEIDC